MLSNLQRLPRSRVRALALLVILTAIFLAVAIAALKRDDATPENQAAPVITAAPTPRSQGAGPQPPLDTLTDQLRGKVIAEQKDALAQQYMKVTPGTHSEEVYIQHCIAVMQLM